MPGHMHHAAGGGQRRSPTAAIGHYLAQMYIGYCLPQMYEGFVRSPLPERLTQLLDEIERAAGNAPARRGNGCRRAKAINRNIPAAPIGPR